MAPAVRVAGDRIVRGAAGLKTRQGPIRVAPAKKE